MSVEMKLQMSYEYQRAQQFNQQQQMNRYFGGMFGQPRHQQQQQQQQSPFLGIKVRRSHILEDSVSIASRLLTSNGNDLKKPLKVKFVNEVGVDAGGVTKEYFQLLVEKLFSVEYGMWIHLKNGFWFNPSSLEDTYALVGLLMGLAVYNGVVLDIHFPRVVYKKLLNDTLPTTLSDLYELQPELVAGFSELLNYTEDGNGKIEDIFCLDFTASYKGLDGTPIVVDLKENGSNIDVTIDNRDEYVQLYLKWYVDDLINVQFNSFSKGFWKGKTCFLDIVFIFMF